MGKKSWSWDRTDLDDPTLMESGFLEGLNPQEASGDGDLADEAREIVWSLLDAAQIDAQVRTITWSDAKTLDIQQSVRWIHEEHSHLPEALIEDKVIAWLELEYAPANYSPEQMEELERRIDRWINTHHRQKRGRKKR